MSSRKIRPLFRDDSTSANSPQSTPERTRSDPRRARGEKEDPESSTSFPRRRRVPESVTRNACLNCKKARAKCDGKEPCKRCAIRVETSRCIYEIHTKHTKEELGKLVKELGAKDYLTEQILQALSTNEKVPKILERLKSSETYKSIVEWLRQSPIDDFETLLLKESQHSTSEASDHETSGISSTRLNEGRFVDSYKRQSENYCSSFLVNTICAMACHLHSVAEGDEVDFERLGGEFSDTVRGSIDAGDKSITTIQAFAVMFLVDCARADGLHASAYLRTPNSSCATACVRSEPAEAGCS
ncbi:hypothetical protein V8E51_014627 [Hyaloscypha variabilis]